MNIHIQNNVLEYENDIELIEEIFKSINENLKENNLHFLHLIIDEKEIYENFDDYIIENIKEIKKIEVVAMPIEQLVNESIISTEQYAKNAIPLINNMAEEFYQKPNENTWSSLKDLFEGIQWIISSIAQINSINSSDDTVNDNEIWEEYVLEVSKLNDIMPELENAIIDKDNILIGDMLLYEIIPVFEIMEEKLGLLLSEAVDKDVK